VAAKQSARAGGQLPPSSVAQTGPSAAQLSAPQQQPLLNQTINSMNSSFFMADNSNLLPPAIYQNTSFAEDEVAESLPVQAIDAVQINAIIGLQQKEQELPSELFGCSKNEGLEVVKSNDEPRKSQHLGLNKEESEVSEIHQELPERLFP